MNSPMDLPQSGLSPEDLQQYTELLLGVGEIAETLQSHSPDASDEQYTVSDPRVIDTVALPLDLQLLSGMEELLSMSFKVVAHRVKRDKEYVWLSNSSLILGFKDGTEIVAQPIPGGGALANKTEGPESTISLTRKDLSDLISRMTHPSQDPVLVDYTDIDVTKKAFEVTSTLETNDMVVHNMERMYTFGNFQVVIQRSNSKLLSCDIVAVGESDINPVTLSLKFNSFSNMAELYTEPEDGGSEELDLQSGDIIKFREIIAELKSVLEVKTVPVDPYTLTQE